MGLWFYHKNITEQYLFGNIAKFVLNGCRGGGGGGSYCYGIIVC